MEEIHIRTKDGTKVLKARNEKIAIFEKSQNAKIEYQACDKEYFFLSTPYCWYFCDVSPTSHRLTTAADFEFFSDMGLHRPIIFGFRIKLNIVSGKSNKSG